VAALTGAAYDVQFVVARDGASARATFARDAR
jgi:hypothetical protein